MLVVITGEPDSGKSLRAEEYVLKKASPGDRIYLATMIPYGEEGAARVDKHRRQREGKGFLTLEVTHDVSRVPAMLEDPGRKTVLLECLANLAANEIFEEKAEDPVTVLLKEVRDLEEQVASLVVVTNRYDESDAGDEETERYIRILEEVNEAIVGRADEVIEVRKQAVTRKQLR